MGGRDADGAGDRGGAATVCNASPLIALAQIGQLELLRDLFSTVAVPPAVVRETPRIAKPAWIIPTPLENPVPPPITSAGLGAGETEAIALAIETGAARILLDDRQARGLAGALGIHVVGTLGLLVLAKDRRLLPAAGPLIEALLETGFRAAPWVINRTLAQAGEGR